MAPVAIDSRETRTSGGASMFRPPFLALALLGLLAVRTAGQPDTAVPDDGRPEEMPIRHFDYLGGRLFTAGGWARVRFGASRAKEEQLLRE